MSERINYVGTVDGMSSSSRVEFEGSTFNATAAERRIHWKKMPSVVTELDGMSALFLHDTTSACTLLPK